MQIAGILETAAPETAASIQLFALCAARGEQLLASLQELCGKEAAELWGMAGHTLPESAAEGHRLVVVAANGKELKAKLEMALGLVKEGAPAVRMRTGIYYGSGPAQGKLAVMFPGQGSQYRGMLGELRARVPGVRRWFEALDAAFGGAGISGLMDAKPVDERLFGLEFGAPLGLVASLAMWELLQGMGVQAGCFLGHSNGEHGALMAGGAIELGSVDETCVSLREFSRLAAGLRAPEVPETMLAVGGLGREKIEAEIARMGVTAWVAIDNCPTQVLVGGPAETLTKLMPALVATGGICSPLPFDRAYHTRLFQDFSAVLEGHYAGKKSGGWRVPVYSCLTAGKYSRESGAMWHDLTAQWSETVRFRETIERAYEDGARVFLEVGPDNKLCGFVDDTLRGKPHVAIAASSRLRADYLQLAHVAADLFAAGHLGSSEVKKPVVREAEPLVQLAWREHETTSRQLQESMDRLLGKLTAQLQVAAGPVQEYPLLGRVLERTARRLRAERVFTSAGDAFCLDHCLGRTGRGGGSPLPVLAFTVSMEIAAEAACCLAGGVAVELSAMRGHRWLALDGGRLTVIAEAERVGAGEQVAVRLSVGGVTAFEAVVTVAKRALAAPLADTAPAMAAAGRWDSGRFYREYAFHGESFQGIEWVNGLGPEGVAARVRVKRLPGVAAESLQLDPAVLDCAGQLAALWLLERTGEKDGLFPFAARSLKVFGPKAELGQALECRATVALKGVGTTLSSFEYVREDGTVAMRFDGFEQRVFRFPAGFGDVLFSRGALRLEEGLLRGEEMEFLLSGGAIWVRALAHQVLGPDELAAWLASGETMEAKTRELLRVTRLREGAACA